MDDADVKVIRNEILQELQRVHGTRMAQGGPDLDYEFERNLKMLPKEGIEWAVAQPMPTVFARSGITLFQIVLDAEKRAVTLTSRPIDGGDLSVGLAWGESEQGQGISIRETNWTFRYVGQKEEMQPWQRISGRVTYTNDGEYADRRERFARGLAGQAGWEPPVGKEPT
jgi:hypothetical protein